VRAAVLAVFVALGLPAAAGAATVTVSAPGTAARTLTVNLGGATRVTVARNGNDVFVSARATDTINASGCSASSGGVICGAESTFSRIVVNGSSGNDEIAISSSITRATTLDGNNGNDELAGGAGVDTIVGDNGDDVLSGGDGNDDLTGSAGNDAISGDAGHDAIDGSAGADLLAGGGQSGDVVEYQGRSAPVRIDLTGATASGEVGEGDVLEGFGVALGGSGGDTIIGGPANERLEGNGGADILAGAGGGDVLNGGAGADALDGGDGADTLNGGAGDDALLARDGHADTALSCGGDRDRLASDPSDPPTTDCEVLAPTGAGEVTVAGEPTVGGALHASFNGGFTGSDSTRAWRWERCTAEGCVPVGAGPSYAVALGDVGAELRAVLRAENEAGAGELASALLGPVPALVAAVDPPAPAPVPPAAAASVTVRSVKCSGRRCRVALTLNTSVTRVRAQLTKGKKSVASVTRRSASGKLTLTVTARRRLARGTYKIRVTATGAKSVTKTVSIKR
jgi:Ca2+-binding RTX toxin-like protein